MWFTGGNQKPVADPANRPPASQPGHGRRERATAQGTPPGTAREGQHHVPGAGATGQCRSRGQDLHRAAGLKAHPAVGQGPAGVVGGDEDGDPLSAARVAVRIRAALRLTVRPPRDFGNPVSVQPADLAPRRRHRGQAHFSRNRSISASAS